MPLDFGEFEEVEADAGERLITTPCSRCGVGCLAAPNRRVGALCGECRPQPAVERTPHYHPGGWWSCGPADEEPEEKSPPPVVAAQGAMPDGGGWPGPVSSLGAYAAAQGWSTKITYSRGYGLKRYRGAWQEEELIAVRFGGHPDTGRQAYAVYRTIAGRASWTWRSVWVWGPDLPPFGQGGATDLREFLKLGPQWDVDSLSLWRNQVEAHVLDLEWEKAAKKARAAEFVALAKEFGNSLDIDTRNALFADTYGVGLTEVRAALKPKSRKKEGAS